MSMSQETEHLTPKEHRLLEHLVGNEGRIVSHAELLEATSITGTTSLRQWILHLRRKVEIDPALPRVIITHRGLGYSFTAKEEARWFPELERS